MDEEIRLSANRRRSEQVRRQSENPNESPEARESEDELHQTAVSPPKTFDRAVTGVDARFGPLETVVFPEIAWPACGPAPTVRRNRRSACRNPSAKAPTMRKAAGAA